jgi:hypothetical protein
LKTITNSSNTIDVYLSHRQERNCASYILVINTFGLHVVNLRTNN